MNKTGWIIFSSAVILLLVGMVVWTNSNKTTSDVSSIDPVAINGALEQNGNIADHVDGKADSKVVLMEYGDFQCPGCGSAHPNVASLMEEYGDRVALVFRNFPLVSAHPNAKAAAAAAEAAGLQGKYWEMHNNLFENQDAWSTLDSSKRTDIFAAYAAGLGLNVDQFKADMASKAISDKISFDQALARKQSVSATPTFFLNGKKLDDTTANSIVQGDLTKIKAELDKLLAE